MPHDHDVTVELGLMHEHLHEIIDRLVHQDRKIDRLTGLIRSINRKENRQMADITQLNADVSKLTDIAESIKTMFDGLVAERDALKAERDALLAADALDQGAIDAADAKLAIVNAKLEALTAVASNTPADPSLGGT